MPPRASALVLCLLCICCAAEVRPSYNRDIRPLLSENCFACHGPDAAHRKGDLRLDVQADAHGRGKSGDRAIVPGAPDASALWHRISSHDEDEIMPPPDSHKRLSDAQKATIREWIVDGAKYEQHWAFVPPRRPALPPGQGNPIDRFIRRGLAAVKLDLAPEADRATLLRRLSFDLNGLPPSLEELAAFISDQAPGAYERQVDRLLASPRFGEHMAVQWLDLARYSDSNGYLQDVRRTGWPWRDWVIQAFNQDMPFDQFVLEQLAGDLLPNANSAQTLATAFLRNHPISVEGGTIEAEYLNEYAADRVETVGTVFMGLTLNCCRCHDHKFDPLPQSDFYGLLAYFNSSTERHLDNGGTAPAYAPFITVASPLDPTGEKVGVMVMDEGKAPKPTFVLTRGLYDQPDQTQPVSRRPPAVFAAGAFAQNRLGLARWLVSAENPLLARVTVNRLWQRIFGTGLVASVDDFGLQGAYPSHPDLLDFLAVEFREHWRTKALLRLIVTSASYRQSATMRADLAQVDPDNRLLGRFPRQRLNAEEIRDAALLSSGLLVETLGGPPVNPYQPPGLWSEKANPGSTTGRFVRGTGDELYRRSVYTFHKRTSPPPTMSIFDAPERNSCNARRSPTNTPLQALATMNDEQHLECARVLAMRSIEAPGDRDTRLAAMFERVTSRRPSTEDLAVLREGLASLEARFKAAPEDATALLKQGEFANADPSLLASAAIADGAVTDADGYAYQAIEPITLAAHGEYLIGGQDSNAFWDSNIAGTPDSAFSIAPAATLVASRYTQGFAKPVQPGQRAPGRWAVGNAKFSIDGSDARPLIDFDRARVDDPEDRRAPNRFLIGNLFKVGDRDIQITALGLHDADDGAFKGGQVGLWALHPPAAEPGSPELAAWMLVASTILNLDETLVRD